MFLRVWQDLDLFNDYYEWKNLDYYHKQTEESDRNFKNLARFNVEFDETKGRILDRKPFLLLEKFFLEAQREETVCCAMLIKKKKGTISSV